MMRGPTARGMCLAWAALLLLILFPTASCLPKEPAPRPDTQDTVMGVSGKYRQAFEEAIRLSRSNDLQGAIEKLRSAAEAHDADPPVLILMGDLHGRSRDFTNAVKWYSRTLVLLGSREDDYPVNVRLKAGMALYLSKRYREAIVELERAWRHSFYRPDDTTVYDMLAAAYEASGASREARQAYLASLAAEPANPETWAALKRLEAKARQGPGEAVGDGVPKPPEAKDFAKVIAAGYPFGWTWENVEAGVRAYIMFSIELKATGRQASSERYLDVAAASALKVGANSFSSHRYEDAIRALALMEQARPLRSLDAETQRDAYTIQLMTHGRLGQFIHGVTAAERLLAMPSDAGRTKVALELLDLLRKSGKRCDK
jgi:tetratricopeptide (TPR) repeat protein